MRIVIFGDSLAWGMRDVKGGGWPDRLKRSVMRSLDSSKRKFNEVFNFGNPGDISTDLLSYIKGVCVAWLGTDPQYKRVNVIILGIGGNDSVLRDKSKYRTSPEQFKKTIRKLIKISKKSVNNVVLIGIPPVVESKTTPIPWNLKSYYFNKNIEKYNKIISSVCKEEKVYFVDTYSKWSKLNYNELLYDGLHPNSKGHELIFEQVKDFLTKKNLVEP